MATDRRSTQVEPLTTYHGHGSTGSFVAFDRLVKHADGTGLYTVPGVMQFVKFLVDISKQTSVNEFQVFPACLVAVSSDTLEREVIAGRSERELEEYVRAVSRAIEERTRQADKAGRFGRTWIVLLTRTMAHNVRDRYVARISEDLQQAARDAGLDTTFSMGIASLTEHLIRDPDDLLKKALRALKAAERREGDAARRGAATVACYDFRTMPLE